MERIQIVVPKCLRKTLLIAAHQSNSSAHLGRNKTFNRLIKHFYWNKIRTDVSYFCNTCHVCQLLCKAKIPPKAPLIKVAIEGEYFRRIVVDLCGPLPACNETNNRLIFTAVDTCTRYPIAIPLIRHTAVDNATEIINIFRTFGHSAELLSDKGSDLTSHVWRELMRVLKVNHTYATIAHPMTPGLCKKYNGTLKRCLTSLVDSIPDNWIKRYLLYYGIIASVQ